MIRNLSITSILTLIAMLAAAPMASAQSTAAASVAPSTGGASCAKIVENAPKVAGRSADQFCPTIETLIQAFRSADKGNHAPFHTYSDPTDAFFKGLAGSFMYYKGSARTILVDMNTSQAVTLRSLDTMDTANSNKRNQLGLILERIRYGDRKGRQAGTVCTVVSKADSKPTFGVWIVDTLLKYGIPALINLFKGDPTKAIDQFDALVTVAAGEDAETSQIRSIAFMKRGTLPTGCNRLRAI